MPSWAICIPKSRFFSSCFCIRIQHPIHPVFPPKLSSESHGPHGGFNTSLCFPKNTAFEDVW